MYSFTFKSMILYELILYKVCGLRFVLFFLPMDIQLFASSVFKKNLPFLHWVSFAPLSKISWLYMCGFISGFSILFHWPMYLFLHKTHYLEYCSYTVNLKTEWFLPLYSSFLKLFSILIPLPFHIYFIIILSKSIKILLGFW